MLSMTPPAGRLKGMRADRAHEWKLPNSLR